MALHMYYLTYTLSDAAFLLIRGGHNTGSGETDADDRV
jgi:hypothetical protein